MTVKRAVDEMTPASLKEWLSGQPHDKLFECGKATRCVIAKYLESVVGYGMAVDEDGAWLDRKENIPFPGWVVDFILAFDSGRKYARTASCAIRILEEVKP